MPSLSKLLCILVLVCTGLFAQSVVPNAVTLSVGQSYQFNTTITSPLWSAQLGRVNTSGYYTAPVFSPYPTNVQRTLTDVVTATNISGAHATAYVTVVFPAQSPLQQQVEIAVNNYLQAFVFVPPAPTLTTLGGVYSNNCGSNFIQAINTDGTSRCATPLSGGGSQINADWNAISGAAQILNKPVIPTTTTQLTEGTNLFFTAPRVLSAMFGLYQAPIVGAPGTWPSSFIPGPASSSIRGGFFSYDCGGQFINALNIDGTVTCAAAAGGSQVNSDWNSVSGVTQILNKPSAFRPTAPTLSVLGGVYSYTCSSSLVITSINTDGTVTCGSVSGGSQVNSDWNSSSGVSQILNKPLTFPPPLPSSGAIGGLFSHDCGSGNSVRTVNTDGTVTCASNGGGGGGYSVGTSIQKGDGSGGFLAAIDGVDLIEPDTLLNNSLPAGFTNLNTLNDATIGGAVTAQQVNTSNPGVQGSWHPLDVNGVDHPLVSTPTGVIGTVNQYAFATCTLNQAAIVALSTTPYNCVAAPGSGYAIVVDRIAGEMHSAGTAYTGGAAVGVLYHGTSTYVHNGTGFPTSFTEQTATLIHALEQPTGVSAVAINTGIDINTGSAFSCSSTCGTLYITIWYQLVSVQ